MTAEIVSVGTELLLGQIVDTHAPTMARILADCGIVCQRRSTVGDNFERLCAVLQESLDRADIVITIGGLGPTLDDLTRDAIAKVLGDELQRVSEFEEHLRHLFESRKLRWTESILRQADKPESARFIDNPNGTAPGLICEKNGKRVIALPGPKGEFDPMANGPVREYLASFTDQVIHSITVRVVGMGESHVEDLVRPLMDQENPTVAPYAHPGEVHLRVTSKASTREEAEAIIQPTLGRIREILGDRVFAFDATSLEEALVQMLAEKSCTVAIAESMTGGELAARISSIAGSSKVFLGGVTCYTNRAKTELVGVPQWVLDEHGAVSERCAEELARRIRDKLGSTYGLAIVGNAGPTADSGEKPVGFVIFALAGPHGVQLQTQQFRAQREDVRRRSTQFLLTWLRDEVLKPSPSEEVAR